MNVLTVIGRVAGEPPAATPATASKLGCRAGDITLLAMSSAAAGELAS
jgi:hypothetical protein